MDEFKLTREERKALVAGEHPSISRPRKPKIQAGDEIVVSRTRPRRHAIEHAGGVEVVRPEPTPLLWVMVKGINLNEDKGWVVHYEVHSCREPKRLLRSKPPRLTKEEAELMRARKDVPFTADEIEQARQETNYTASPASAADNQEVVDDDTLREFTRRARAAESDHLAGLVDALSDVEAALAERQATGVVSITGEIRRAQEQIRRAKQKIQGQRASIKDAA